MKDLRLLASALLAATAACGGASPEPISPADAPPSGNEPSARPEAAAPASAAPAAPVTCESALAAKRPDAETICDKACDDGGPKACMELADRLGAAAKGGPEPAIVVALYDKACQKKSDEACMRAAMAVADTDKPRAVRLLDAGCRDDPSSEFAKKSCMALGMAHWRAQGVPTDRDAAEAAFKRGCNLGHAPACSAAREVRREIDAANAPPPPVALEGTLVSRAGKVLRVKVAKGAAPAIGARAEVQRYFESKPGDASPLGILGGLVGGTVSGWVVIADATVTKVEGEVVTLEIREEQSQVTLNGKKVNHFSPGARIKLSLAAAPRSST